MLGAKAKNVTLVAVVNNRVYNSIAYTRAFDNQEGLSALPNWLYLTGSVPQLQQVWKLYAELNFNPGPGTASSKSSFAAELAAEAQRVMA